MPGIISVSRQNGGVVIRRIEMLETARRNNVELKIAQQKSADIYDKVYRAARHKTGRMRASIDVQVTENTIKFSVGAYYSRFHEEGWRKRGKQYKFPFFFQNVWTGVTEMLTDIKLAYGFAYGR